MLLELKILINFLKNLRYIFDAGYSWLKAFWYLRDVTAPSITFFAGSHLSENSFASKLAYELSEHLLLRGFNIVTGGGNGGMGIANKAAYFTIKRRNIKNLFSIGISLHLFDRKNHNKFLNKKIYVKYFFTRKWFLVKYSKAFVVLPGGFGTLDEFFEILTLIQTGVLKNYPVVLLDSTYWNPMLDWLKTTVLKNGLVREKDLKSFYITDSVTQALAFIDSYNLTS